MAERISVTALVAQTHQGRSIEKGETFEVRPIEAASLKYLGKVLLASDSPSKKPKAKRQYRRRDMQAES